MILHDFGDGVALDVLVVARASRAKVGPMHDDRLKVAVTSPPVDGEANEAVCELLAKRLGVSKSSVAIVSGHRSKRKTVLVKGLSTVALAKKLDEVLGR